MALLDASALLAALYDEPGAGVVAEHLVGAALLTVNLEETVRALLRKGMETTVAHRVIDAMRLDIIDFTRDMAWRSAELQAILPKELGLADRACLAAASVLDMPVVTTDGLWREAGHLAGVRVISIR